LALFWHFYAEKVSSEGKYYYSVLIDNTFNLIYLFVSRHEVHSMNTYSLRNAGR